MIHKPGSPCVGSARKKDKHNRRSIANNSSSIQPSLVFRITYGQGNGPSLLRRTFLEAGMSEFDPEHHSENQWDLWWKGFRFRECELALLKTSQRVNHHPAPLGRQTDITRKDGLLRAIRHMCVTYPKCSSLLLFPTTFNLPREEHRFVSAFCQRARSARTKLCIQNQHTKGEELCDRCLAEGCTELEHQTQMESLPSQNIWILKPADMSRGRGVFVFNQLEDLVYISKSVVQKYISDVLLIEGYKFDLRLYAVVPSYSPFIVYICTEGLIRFATEPYNLSDLKNVYSHLTNSSINISGPGYSIDKTGIGLGCKWTIGQFRQWMADRNINDRFLWIRIQALIILTLLSQASETPKVPNAYELLGFDILVDSHLRPWLLEVNANPSLSNQCMVDEVVKKPLLNSILEMLRLEQSPMGYADERVLYSASLRTHMFPNKSYKDDAKKDPIGHAQREPASHREGAEKSALTQELLSSLGHGESDLSIPRADQAMNNHWFKGGTSYSLLDFKSPSTDNRRNRNGVSFSIGSVRDAPFMLNSINASTDKQLVSNRSWLDANEYSQETCPLYGPGSEWLLPELTSLRIRFSSSLEMNIQMNKLARQRNCSPSSLSSKSTINRLSESKNDFNCHFACENWLIQEKSRAGHKIIPHAFGQLKLAFPFNLIARIACAKERGGYPDQRLIVQQVGRLVQYYARLTKGTAPSTDYSVIDIPEIWEVRQ
ncbi:unnamed protein product [Dicrocoelium dendriticum]|nr:unnamed protein product [Dicrocoelium dendriticum]